MMTCVKGRSVTDTRRLVYLLPKPKVIYGIRQTLFLVFFSQHICISTNFHGLGAFAMERRTLLYFSHSFSGESEAEVTLVTIPSVVGWLPKKGENRLLPSGVGSIEHVRTIIKGKFLALVTALEQEACTSSHFKKTQGKQKSQKDEFFK